jgi:hypothetical protein
LHCHHPVPTIIAQSYREERDGERQNETERERERENPHKAKKGGVEATYGIEATPKFLLILLYSMWVRL